MELRDERPAPGLCDDLATGCTRRGACVSTWNLGGATRRNQGTDSRAGDAEAIRSEAYGDLCRTAAIRAYPRHRSYLRSQHAVPGHRQRRQILRLLSGRVVRWADAERTMGIGGQC